MSTENDYRKSVLFKYLKSLFFIEKQIMLYLDKDGKNNRLLHILKDTSYHQNHCHTIPRGRFLN